MAEMHIPSYLSPWWTKVLLHLKAHGVRRTKPWTSSGDIGLMDDWEAPAAYQGRKLEMSITLTYDAGKADAWFTIDLVGASTDHRIFEWDSMDKVPDKDLLTDAAFGFIKEPDPYE